MDMTNNDEQQEDTMNCGLSVLERNLLQSKLRELEDTVPPREVWQRIEAQASAEGLFRAGWAESNKWFAGAAVAAAVVLAVLNLEVTPTIDAGSEQFQTVPPYTQATDSSRAQKLTTLNALMVQSQQIERDLRALPSEPSLVRAGTAVTIAELEDHIAAIDFTLNHPQLDLSPGQEEIYWRERVRLMNSLLSLRTAQAQRVSF
jgi:hypothetical protein